MSARSSRIMSEAANDIARIDTGLGDELFAELKGSAAVDFADLAALEDGGREFVATLKAYIAAHPKLDVIFLTHRGPGVDELVVRWRWRP